MTSNYLRALALYCLLGWSILILGRVALAVLLLPLPELFSNTGALLHAVYNAFRFDCQSLAYVNLLPLLAMIVASFIKSDCRRYINEGCRWYYTIAYTLLAIFTIIDLGFYNNFGAHLNITFFDFFDENPLSLLKTMWEDYPVLWLLLLVAGIAIGLRAFNPFKKPGDNKHHYILSCIVVLLWPLAMRGTVSLFPLRAEDLRVCNNVHVNAIIPNAPYMLKKVYKEKKTAFELLPESSILAQYGFADREEALKALGITEPSIFTTVAETDSACVRPNVVIIFSESWSGFINKFGLENTEGDKLLCGMEKHFAEDYLFLNFQSAGNATIASIESLIISTPFPRVFRSRYRFNQFPSSIALPFNANGYETIFISGMDQEWENIGESLIAQGFDKIIDKFSLLNKHPEYTYNMLGIYDHLMLQSIIEELESKPQQPKMMFVMTTTNHPPFHLSKDIELPALSEAFYKLPIWGNNKSVQQKYIRGAQYANMALSSFMNALKGSGLADNTIVIITGDHNVRTAMKFGQDEKLVSPRWMYSVPLYVYLPPSIREIAESEGPIDTSKWGSHQDIIPSLARFTFGKGTQYLNIGQNLFSAQTTPYNTFSFNPESILSHESFAAEAQRKVKAAECLLKIFCTETMRSANQ